MTLLLQYTLIFASVLILVALGGCFSEHSGVINLGLEGIMIMGALGGALTMRYLADSSSARAAAAALCPPPVLQERMAIFIDVFCSPSPPDEAGGACYSAGSG